jgi:hypothetical protein
MADKSLLGRLEELLDLSLCKFSMESGRLLWPEVSCLLMSASFDLQLDMPIIQRLEHLAEDVEKLIIACLLYDFGSVRVVLLFPIDIPQLEKWVSVVEGVPQGFEILVRVAKHDGDVNPSAPVPRRSGNPMSRRSKSAAVSNQTERAGRNFTASSETASWIA